jgi:general secretion pathway protein A
MKGTAAPAAPTLTPALRAELKAFQLAHGLPPDGRPGPLTYMQLNRASGVDEPRLRTEP